MTHSTFLKVITTVSAYIKLLEPTPMTKWAKFGPTRANLGQLGPSRAKIGPKELNVIGVPIVIVDTCPFGSRHMTYGAVIKEMLFHVER